MENVSAELGILKDIQLAVGCGVVCRGLGDRRAIERDIGFTSATSASLIVKLNELREVGDRDASRIDFVLLRLPYTYIHTVSCATYRIQQFFARTCGLACGLAWVHIYTAPPFLLPSILSIEPTHHST